MIGQHVVDQFTFHLHRFLTTRLPPHPSAAGGSAGGGASSAAGGPAPSLQDLLSYITAQRLSSEVQVWAELYPRNLSHVPATHFFGAPAAPPPAAASGVDAAPGAAGAAGGGGSSGSSAAAAAAAQALQALAGQRQDEPHAAERPDEGAQLAQQPLFALLEAAGGGAAGGPPGGAATQAAATVAAWAAAAALSRWLFRL